MAFAALLAGAGLDTVFGGVVAARKFAQANPQERILKLLHHEFGSRAQLYATEFDSWADDPQLIALINGLIDGKIQPNEQTRRELEREIAPRLSRTPEGEERAALAADIADALLTGYVLAYKDFGDYGQALIRKMDDLGERNAQESEALRALIAPSPASALAAALLVGGPLRQAAQQGNVDRAEALETEGDPAQAAAILQEAADALDDHGLTTVSPTYRMRAARLLVDAGQHGEAATLIERVVWAQIGERSAIATLAVRQLEQILGDVPLVRGLQACAQFPAIAWSNAWLKQAIDADDDPGRALRFRAALSTMELLTGEGRVAVDIENEIKDSPLEDGPRLDVALNAIDALNEQGKREAADAAWLTVKTWISERGGPATRGRCWARRAYLLAMRGDQSGAVEAYRHSMDAWARVQYAEGQVADALFSLQAVQLVMGAWTVSDQELRPIAAELRPQPGTPVQRAERLQHNATAARVAGRFPDAHRDYWFALMEYVAMGSLQGVLEVTPQLAELYAVTGRPVAAVSFYCAGGRAKDAAKLAANLPAKETTAALNTGGAPWARAATYDVLSAFDTAVPVDVVAAFADQLMEDVDAELPSLASAARRALANLVLQFPEELRDEALARVSAYLDDAHLLDVARASAVALMRVSQLGIADAAERLVASYLAGRPLADIDPSWVPDLIRGRPDLRDRVLEAARDGNPHALHVLPFTDIDVPSDEILTLAMTDQARKWSEVHTRTVTEADGQREESIGMATNLAQAGLVAKDAEQPVRDAVLQRMSEIVLDEQDSEANRAAAVDAIFNMAAVIPDDRRSTLAESLRPLAAGDYQRHRLDTDEVDLLSNFQFNQNSTDMLRASAMRAVARFAELGTDPGGIDELVAAAWASGSARPTVAAVETLARLPELPAPIGLPAMLRHGDPHVRGETIRALRVRNAGLLHTELPKLMRDSSYSVRLAALNVAKELGEQDLLERIAEEDPDAYLRGLARIGLETTLARQPDR